LQFLWAKLGCKRNPQKRGQANVKLFLSRPLGFTSPIILATFVSGIVLLALFIVLQKRIEIPLINLTLFKDRALNSCFIVRFCWQLLWVGLFLVLSLMFQNILDYSVLHTGFLFLIASLVYAVVSPFGGKLSGHYSARRLIIIGSSVFCVATKCNKFVGY